MDISGNMQNNLFKYSLLIFYDYKNISSINISNNEFRSQ
jgi:hypothetical protein